MFYNIYSIYKYNEFLKKFKKITFFNKKIQGKSDITTKFSKLSENNRRLSADVRKYKRVHLG